MDFAVDIIELVNSVINIVEMLNLIDMFIASIAPTEPLTIPQISPITSLHILAIVLEFFISFTASLEPLIFLELFAWNDASFAVNTAVPIISNIIPIPINIIHNIIKSIVLLYFDIKKFDVLLKIKAIKKVIKNALIIQLSFFI